MKTETKKTVCCTINHDVLIDAKVEAEMPNYGWYRNPKDHAEQLKKSIKEFENFLRDHRSQDAISLEVVCIKEDQCSECNQKWDQYIDEETGEIYCGNCGAILTVETHDEEIIEKIER